jgi:L-histidine Nalpha-methyltransferase
LLLLAEGTPTMTEALLEEAQRLHSLIGASQRHGVDDTTLKALLRGSPKRFHPSLGYDEEGSHYFAKLCEQPEYYLTRTERRLLEKNAEAMLDACSFNVLVDLGCGNLEKTQAVIYALIRRSDSLTFLPCDIDRSIILQSTSHLRHFYRTIAVEPFVGSYENCLRWVGTRAGTKLFCFLGSTFGNMTRDEQTTFLSKLRTAMTKSDCFLLGVDLLKPHQILERAYNDTAGFARLSTLHMLKVINKAYGATFDPSLFCYAARFDETDRKIKCTLESLTDQTVEIPLLDLRITFEKGEKIEAESMEKFKLEDLVSRIEAAGLRVFKITLDKDYPYALVLSAPE